MSGKITGSRYDHDELTLDSFSALPVRSHCFDPRKLSGDCVEPSSYSPVLAAFRFLTPPQDGTTSAGAPAFSVIIAAYQAAATIGDALASVLGQTTPPAEVIVCDDGSTDDLERALDPFADRIVLLRQENRGAAAARNAATRAASGDFVVILDADDVYESRRIEALIALARARSDLDIVTTDAYYVTGGSRTGRFYEANHFETIDQRSAILKSCFVGGWPGVRRSRLLEIGGFDESLRHSEDWDCWIRLIFSGSRAGLVDEPLMEYRVTEGSLTSQRVASLESRVAVVEKTAREQHLSDQERRVLTDRLRLHKSRAAVVRALAGIDGRDRAGVRRRVQPLIQDRALPAGVRFRAAAAWLQPSHARRWLMDGMPRAARLTRRP